LIKKHHPEDYAYILESLQVSPEELKSKIDYFKERDKLLTKHAHVLKKHVNELKHHIKLRQTVEKDLQHAKEHIELIHRVTPTAIYTVNTEGIITMWNDKAAELTGYTTEEVVGQSCSILGHNTENAYSCIFNTDNNEVTEEHEVELIKKNGDRLTIIKNATLLKSAEGAILGAIESFIDITERKETEIDLIRLSRAVNQSPSVVVITDLSGNIVYINPQFTKLTGYTHEEVIGHNPRILKSGKQGPEVYKELWKTLTEGNEWRGEFQNKKKNGELYWEWASISPIRNQEGVTINYLAVKEDITQRKKAEDDLIKTKEELEVQTWGLLKTNSLIKILYRELSHKNEELTKLDQMKSEFISTVSHELRTPLTIIREGVSQVHDEILGATTEEQRDFLSIVLSNVDRLSRIINELLDMSQIESGKLILQKSTFNIVELVEELINSFTLNASEKNIFLKESFSHKTILLNADKDKVMQIFTNLVGNAYKFTKEGTITIQVRELAHHIECAVIDTGEGIAQENLPKLFNKFQQFERVDGPGDKGTGLGLSIVKGIVELHKGNIWATSSLDKGTRFTFTLPKDLQSSN